MYLWCKETWRQCDNQNTEVKCLRIYNKINQLYIILYSFCCYKRRWPITTKSTDCNDLLSRVLLSYCVRDDILTRHLWEETWLNYKLQWNVVGLGLTLFMNVFTAFGFIEGYRISTLSEGSWNALYLKCVIITYHL